LTERFARGPLRLCVFRTDTGVVDEDVETSEVLLDLLYCGGDGGVVVCVELHEAEGAFGVFGLDFVEDGGSFGEVAGADDDVVGGGC